MSRHPSPRPGRDCRHGWNQATRPRATPARGGRTLLRPGHHRHRSRCRHRQGRVATGSLYKNFSGKADLVAAYLADRDQRSRVVWEPYIKSETDSRARILGIFDAHDAWTRDTGSRRGCAHVAAATQLPRDHLGVAVAVDHKQRVTARPAELAVAAGVGEPDRLVADLALVYDGMLSAQAIGIDPDPVARARGLAERLIDLRCPVYLRVTPIRRRGSSDRSWSGNRHTAGRPPPQASTSVRARRHRSHGQSGWSSCRHPAR